MNATAKLSHSSAIIHETSQIVVIATGLKRKSKNAKTGNMIQVWILNRNQHPVESMLNGQDKRICGTCPLRGHNAKERACYVRLDRGPATVWKAYQRGVYPHLLPSQYAKAFAGRYVRFGAYGDPVFIPFKILQAVAKACAGFTGYTHQWRNPIFAAYKQYLMASTEIDNFQDAITAGWRTFLVTAKPVEGLMVCPASVEFERKRGWKLNCQECGRCAGLSVKGRSVQIQPHGFGKKYLQAA